METKELTVKEILALGKVERTEEIRAQLCKALNSPDPNIRIAGIQACAESLFNKLEVKFIMQVVKMVHDDEEKVKSEARKLLKPYKQYWYKVAADAKKRKCAKPPKPTPIKRRHPSELRN